MPHIGNSTSETAKVGRLTLDGLRYAHASVDFAALAIISRGMRSAMPEHHLYVLSIELAFKSMALRVGATDKECRAASHRISKMIALI